MFGITHQNTGKPNIIENSNIPIDSTKTTQENSVIAR